MGNAKNRLETMQGMLMAGEGLCSFTLDADLCRADSGAQGKELYYKMFMVSNSRSQAEAHFAQQDNVMIAVDSIGIGWIIGAQKASSGQMRYYQLFGPFFILETNEAYLYQICSRLKVSDTMLQDMIRELKAIPSISLGRAQKYAVMLQYCLTKASAPLEDITISNERVERIIVDADDGTDYHGTWEAEQRFFRAVSEGEEAGMHRNIADFSHGKVGEIADHPVRQLKNMLIVKTVLCSRAAMVGGVSPDGSYTLSDHFMQEIERQNNISALTNLSEEILQTFLYRTRQAKKGQEYSAPIRKTMEYVQDHIREKIVLKDIASEVGYAEYYLSSKFKKEVGMSINSFITECKISEAQNMFDSGRFSVSDVSDRLGFSTASYFGAVFKQATGLTPSEYLAGQARRQRA